MGGGGLGVGGGGGGEGGVLVYGMREGGGGAAGREGKLRVVDLDQMYRDAKGKCCVSVYDVSPEGWGVQGGGVNVWREAGTGQGGGRGADPMQRHRNGDGYGRQQQ